MAPIKPKKSSSSQGGNSSVNAGASGVPPTGKDAPGISDDVVDDQGVIRFVSVLKDRFPRAKLAGMITSPVEFSKVRKRIESCLS